MQGSGDHWMGPHDHQVGPTDLSIYTIHTCIEKMRTLDKISIYIHACMHAYILVHLVYGLTVHTACWGPTDLFFKGGQGVVIVHSDR